jgi:hypothetical protein
MLKETSMNAAAARRLLLRCIAPATLGWPAAQAQAFELPRFEDLRPRWNTLSEGDSLDQVLRQMGPPNRRSEVRTLGVSRTDLVWKDIRGNVYTARFLVGRLFAKEVRSAP